MNLVAKRILKPTTYAISRVSWDKGSAQMNDGSQSISETVRPIIGGSVTPFWGVPWQFAVHAIVGTSIFAVIAAFATLIDLAVRKLEIYGIGSVIIFGLRAGEYLLFVVDLVLFNVFLWRTARRTIRHL